MTESENGKVPSKVWMDILKEMLANPSAPVSCPKCKSCNLTVVDTPRKDEKLFERDQFYRNCGARCAYYGVSAECCHCEIKFLERMLPNPHVKEPPSAPAGGLDVGHC
jgi:hypothetical protein